MSDSFDDSHPVTKVGAAVLRFEHGVPEVLVIQPKPKPKSPQDLPPIGLVRGTRMYRTPEGESIDANHDGRTAPPEGSILEPVRETLRREIEEEAGVTTDMLQKARIVDMGPRVFASLKKTPYRIHWFVVVLGEEAQRALPHRGFQDSLHSEWVRFETLQQYVAANKASPGYLAVVEEAMRLGAPD